MRRLESTLRSPIRYVRPTEQTRIRRIGTPQNGRNGVILFVGLKRWLLYAKNSQDQRIRWLLL